MTKEGHTNSGPSPAPRREVAAAIDELNVCVERMRALLPRVHAAIDRRVEVVPRRTTRPRIFYGGGQSAFERRVSEPRRPTAAQPATAPPPVPREPEKPDTPVVSDAAVEDRPLKERPPEVHQPERHRPLPDPPARLVAEFPLRRHERERGHDPEREDGPARSSRQLLVAADLALAGYSKEQIGARLSALGDPNADHTIDDAFE